MKYQTWHAPLRTAAVRVLQLQLAGGPAPGRPGRVQRFMRAVPVLFMGTSLLLGPNANALSKSTEYDAMGLPIRMVDAMGQATIITRDILGRPTGITYADGKITTLRYDLAGSTYNVEGSPKASIGSLSEIQDRSGIVTYKRDMFSRVALKHQTLASGLVQKVSYGYDKRGLHTSTTYPDGSVLGYVYDHTGQLIQLNWNDEPLIRSLTWNPMGQPTGWAWAFVTPGLNASRRYDTAARLTNTEFSSYIYDAAGRITNITQQLFKPADTDPTHTTVTSANVSWTVGYDPVGRITSFNAPGNFSGFAYDANGNRLSGTHVVGGQTTSRSYTVASTSNQLTGFSQKIGSATTSVSYGRNANGDMTSDGLRRYTYDAEGRLSAVTTGATDASPTTRYAHNALGQRVFKTEPLYSPADGDESNPGFMGSLIGFFSKIWGPSASDAEKLGFAFMYDEEGTLIAETGTGGANSTGSTQYIYLPTANGPLPIAAVINGTKYAVHSDHLNTPRRLTSPQGYAVWQWAYSAFGDEEPTLANKRFTSAATTPSSGATNVAAVDFRLRYPGQYGDKESGLFYNYFRSYNPGTGRYPEADPIGLAGGMNRFTYADLNPLGFVDPLGLMGQGSGTVGRPGGQSNRQNPTVSAFGCMGLACVTGGVHNDGPQFSAELSFGGGIEICDPSPPPKTDPAICRISDGGLYATTGQPQVQPFGVPVPARVGGAFIGPAWKSNGQFCLRIGPHVSAPFVPSLDIGGLRN